MRKIVDSFELTRKKVTKKGFNYYKYHLTKGKKLNVAFDTNLYSSNSYSFKANLYPIKHYSVLTGVLILTLIICEYLLDLTEITPLLSILLIIPTFFLIYYLLRFSKSIISSRSYFKKLRHNLDVSKTYYEFIKKCKNDKMRPYHILGDRKGEFQTLQDGWKLIIMLPNYQLLGFISFIALVLILILNSTLLMYMWETSVPLGITFNLLFLIILYFNWRELETRITQKSIISLVNNEFKVQTNHKTLTTKMNQVISLTEEEINISGISFGSTLKAKLKNDSEQVLINLTSFDKFEREFFINRIIDSNQHIKHIYLLNN